MHDICIFFCSKIIFDQKLFSYCWDKFDYPGSIVYFSWIELTRAYPRSLLDHLFGGREGASIANTSFGSKLLESLLFVIWIYSPLEHDLRYSISINQVLNIPIYECSLLKHIIFSCKYQSFKDSVSKRDKIFSIHCSEKWP